MLIPSIQLLLLSLTAGASHAWVSQAADWVVAPVDGVARVEPTSLPAPGGASIAAIVLTNGQLARTFALAPCFASVDLELLPSRTRFLRALAPEAQLSLDGIVANVGGCLADSAHPEFFDPAAATLAANPSSLVFLSYQTAPVVAPYPYTPGSYHSPNATWPPKGLHLTAHFAAPALFPDANASSFTGPLAGLELPCAATGCLVGFPSCGSAVEGQCSWPRDTAVSECGKWPACAGVQCNPSRDDCQARDAASLGGLAASHYSVYLRAGSALASKNATVDVHYELYDGMPVLKKWVTVSAGASAPPAGFVVDDVLVELLRAPNFAPEQTTIFQVQPNNPTPFSQTIVPERDQSFPGRTQQLWFFDDAWDACCDQELHVSYSYYTYLKERTGRGRGGSGRAGAAHGSTFERQPPPPPHITPQVGYSAFDVTYGGPTGPGTLVTRGAPFESIAIRELLHDTTDWERQGLATRRMQAALAPQLMESPLYAMITDISSTAAFRLAISQAASVGLELVVVGYGAQGYCGMCPAQLQNASWVAWFKSNVDFARSLGLGVSAYTLMQHNGWGESVPAAEQVLNRDGSRGGIACFATDWHAAYRQSVLDFAATVGLAGVETDGQYEGAPCADTSGDHHHNGVAGSWQAQMAATTDFNIKLKAQGIYQTGADAYWWSGANKWNHADTDAGYSLPSVWERLSVGRDYVYDSTTTRLHSSGMYGIGDVAASSRSCDPSPGRFVCIDWSLASFLGQGVVPDTVAASLWEPSDPDAPRIAAIFTNWSAFFVAHRPVLTSGASLHIVRPSARSWEATAHLLADAAAPERGLITVYNPSGAAVRDSVAVSLYYAGVAPGASVTVTPVRPDGPPGAPVTHVVGTDGGAIFDVVVPLELAPYSYGMWVIA